MMGMDAALGRIKIIAIPALLGHSDEDIRIRRLAELVAALLKKSGAVE
jgi:hypothetical protein